MYEKIRCATGWGAIFGGFGYFVWSVIAMSDGPSGIEIPVAVSVPVMTAIILLAFTSIVIRVAEYAVRRIVSDHFDLLVNAVTAKLQDHQQQLQLLVKAEVAAALSEVSKVAFRAAIVNQATAAAAAATADAEGSVTHINGRR